MDQILNGGVLCVVGEQDVGNLIERFKLYLFEGERDDK
jgi:hypothetical protein